MSDAPALSITGLSKRFGGALALDNVALTVMPGEVHGLLGSNGSGKSTLIKVLAGFHTPEPGGQVRLYGRTAPLPIPGAKVRALGLAFVHQHLGLIGSLSVTENLMIPRLATGQDWRLNWSREYARADAVFARYGLSLDPRAEVARLSPVEQALLAIVRAVEDLKSASNEPGVLVLDEPTPFLPRAGVEQLFRLVKTCVAGGASVIFVSHDVDEVREITDRATILRDGKLIDTVVTRDTSHDAFVQRIIGRSMAAYGGRSKLRPNTDRLVRVENLTGAGIGPVTLDIAGGEILGLTGLIGSGYDTVPALLYGARKASNGRLHIGGHSIALRSIEPPEALSRGIVYLPADRLGAAGVGSLPVGDNVGLPVLKRLRRGLGLFTRDIESHASILGAQAGVRPNIPAMPLSALSGGNAQKALLAKWLQVKPQLMLLDEPTQGVDVGARQDIWDGLDRAAAGGACILIGSTDYDQLAKLCHRVLVFSRGQVVTELCGATLTKEAIAEACFRSTPLPVSA